MIFVLKALGVIASVTLGGSCIGAAVKCYKKGQYGGFGVGVMMSLLFVYALFKALLF